MEKAIFATKFTLMENIAMNIYFLFIRYSYKSDKLNKGDLSGCL